MNAKPIVSWIGGKRKLAAKILPFFPDHRCYVEPFAGGGALLFARSYPAETEVLNDINGELVNLYRIVQYHLEEFVRQFKWALSSRQVFKWLQETRPETLTDIQRAARFYYLQQLAFGGKVTGQNFGTATTSPPRLNLLRIEEDLSAAHLRLANVYIEHLTWSDCVERYDRDYTLFYLDPPYWETEGYGVPFPFSEYEKIADIMRSIKGKAILSINDHPDIRALFKDFSMEQTDYRYTLNNSAASGSSTELIIFNWDIKAQPAGLF